MSDIDRTPPDPFAVVYVAHEPRETPEKKFDFGPLKLFGELRFVFPSTFWPGYNAQASMDAAAEALEGFSARRDFFAAVGGDPLAIAICATLVRERAIDQESETWNWLRYERPMRKGGAVIPAAYSHLLIPVWPTGYVDVDMAAE